MTPSIILSLAAGRSMTGFAVFCGKHLEYYGIISLARCRNTAFILKATDRFFNRINRRFSIGELAIRSLNASQKHSLLLPVVQKQIIVLAERTGWKVYEFNGSEVNAFIAGESAKPSNRATTAYLIEQFPELSIFNDPQIPSRPAYYLNLFKAVAVGYMRVTEGHKRVSRD